MPYEPFHERFPEIAKKETRSIIALNDPDLPERKYGLIEAYCNEPDCDCRRVFFHVHDWQKRELVAVIAYGWEDREYYVEWFGRDDAKVIAELQGPVLNVGSPQSEFAPALLEQVKYVLQDERYVARIKRHYRMFKETVDDGQPERVRSSEKRPSKKVGRNDPCPCGSGKKYKRCCGRRARRRKRRR
ncbi:MAG: Protein translocase subunit SecA [Anaerolineales bacterium]|nr:Protein translocase subunit SecA [Anaerolineales bacterium]